MFQKEFFKILLILIAGVVIAAGVLIFINKYLVLSPPIPTPPAPPISTQEAVCVYKDGSCCQEQGICNAVMVSCEDGFRADIKGCNEKCEAIFECIPDISDWKTYRNEEYGFEVKYPDRWNVNEEWWGSAVKTSVFNFKSAEEDRGIYIQIQTSMFEELWRDSCDIITEKEVVIDGVTGSKILGVFKGTNTKEIFVLVKKGENFYHIHLPPFYQNEEFLDQILFTFRFLDSLD